MPSTMNLDCADIDNIRTLPVLAQLLCLVSNELILFIFFNNYVCIFKYVIYFEFISTI